MQLAVKKLQSDFLIRRRRAMQDFFSQHLSEIVSAIAGAVVGAVGGSLLTFQFTRNRVQGAGLITDQSRATAGGDIVGGDKNSSSNSGSARRK
jgi:hypothetical protein